MTRLAGSVALLGVWILLWGEPSVANLASGLLTVAVVVATQNLAAGVLVGVLLSGIFFAWKIGQIFQVSTSRSIDGRRRTYVVHGQVFCATANAFIDAFDF